METHTILHRKQNRVWERDPPSPAPLSPELGAQGQPPLSQHAGAGPARVTSVSVRLVTQVGPDDAARSR